MACLIFGNFGYLSVFVKKIGCTLTVSYSYMIIVPEL